MANGFQYLCTNPDLMAHLIAPSLLSADFNMLGRDIDMVNESTADWFHLDIMDGVFVPNISFGMPIIRAIRKRATKPLDVHLMIVDPDRYLETFRDAGADILTVHYEACTHLHRTLSAIRELGMKAGVALNPHTPVDGLLHILDSIDMVLFMSVNPGFGGQKFITPVLDKIAYFRQVIGETGHDILLEVDGGVNEQTGAELIQSGADVLVAGNYIFASDDPKGRITTLRNLES